MSKERTCLFCQNSYQYCPNCKDYSLEPTWKFNFDTEKCHDLYNVIAGYNIGIRSIEDVKVVLNKYNVTDYSIFSKALREKLSDNFSETKEEVKNKNKDEVKEEPKEEIKDEPKGKPKEETNQKKQTFSKGNNNSPRKIKKNNYGRRDGE